MSKQPKINPLDKIEAKQLNRIVAISHKLTTNDYLDIDRALNSVDLLHSHPALNKLRDLLQDIRVYNTLLDR